MERDDDGARGALDVSPLFILSPSQRDELGALAVRCGWRPIAARREAGAESRFLASPARVALVDGRGLARARIGALVASLADAAEAAGAALLVLLDEGTEAWVPDLVKAGATHYLAGDLTHERLGAALVMADALATRLVGNVAADRSRHAVQRGDALFWRWDGAARTLSLSPALAALLRRVFPDIDHARWSVADFVRALERGDRRGAVVAIRQAMDDLMPSAFAHGVPGQPGRRLVQHLYPDARGFTGEVEDLASARIAETRERDFLTGLANRHASVEWLGMRIEDGVRPLVLLLGLGGLDRVNSAYGRTVGDAMLGRVAARMTRLVDAMGTHDALVARLTGTDFLVALGAGEAGQDMPVERAGLLAGELIAEVARPFTTGDHFIRLSGVCGIAQAQPGDDAERLLRRAAGALADVRPGGAAGTRIRVAETGASLMDEDALQNDLRRALDDDQIQILYQPQYAMEDDRIVGVEALARWRHPHYGEIGAAALFGLAERSDFLLPLSAHVQARALAEAARWPAALGQLRVAVNVTAADIAQPDFVATFLAAVDASGFSRDRLTVELTESGLVVNLEGAAALLNALRREGLCVAIDDFGTGYSSLAYLKALPLDYLKIDASLARDIAGSPRDRVIVRSIIDMARSLDLGVIAEGVETEQQLALLARAGVHVYQGFLRSRPITSTQLAELVAGVQD